ncbi:hypothetical protein BO70DRAFT_378902 [Aspergillus heteromorphus CBS 117.55]|uniref:DUF7598 domain-containing protein n=1 Tax=Aspergillus heteromorphus CBS 117.55 TaxID=1448321 RepID=A0A317WPX9_9EURO|nr:uncharacterized protein BO70DRAFT_378902 [Aspergillus heteromorphus CBS 117.55]PWY86290.1 hypothetical protein BO70DRAFT_378902 [Aspergillus heteromorphus CBS 117.55]
MMAALKESLAGPGFVILNAIRVINIIVFLDLIAASVVMLIKISLLTSFFFFEAVSHVVAVGVSIFLIVSELPVYRGYFDKNWPLLGQDSGFITLAVPMLMLGVGVLGDLNTKATSQDALGLAFWRIVLSAGILAMIMSVVNVAASFVFADSDLGVSARHVRVYGAVAPQKVMTRSSSQRTFQLSVKKEETLPTYSPQGTLRRQMSMRQNTRFPLKISSPVDPINLNDAASSKYSRDSAGVTIPDISHHPAMHAAQPDNPPTTTNLPALTRYSLKSLFIFFAPIIIPRAINYYRTFRVSLATRPAPRPLPQDATRALNVFFFTITLCLCLSLPFNPHAPHQSIFTLTHSRLSTSTDTIFARLARLRPNETLTPADTLLKSHFSAAAARSLYLRFGPDAITNCLFCSLDSPSSYAFYYIPFHVLVPHLLHLAVIGLVTSAAFAGLDASKWRSVFTMAAIGFALVDAYVMLTYEPLKFASAAVRAGVAVPPSSYYQIGMLRPLAFAVFDGLCALLVYLSATRRYFFSPPSRAEQVDQLVSNSLSALAGTTSKLHAVSVARNAVVRDKVLKDRDDAYWRTVVAMNIDNPAFKGGNGGVAGDGNGNGMAPPTSIWEEEEVIRAMSRAMAGQGGMDLAKLGVDAAEYVNGITAGLEGNQ